MNAKESGASAGRGAGPFRRQVDRDGFNAGHGLQRPLMRPTQEAQVMPSIGSDIAPEKSVTRTGAFIAASFSRSKFQVLTEAEASNHGKVKACFPSRPPLTLTALKAPP